MRKEIDVIGLLLNMLIIIILIIGIYMLINLLFGNTPDAIEIISVLVGLLIANAIKTAYDFGRFRGRFEMFERHVSESFGRVREDISELKEIIKNKK